MRNFDRLLCGILILLLSGCGSKQSPQPEPKGSQPPEADADRKPTPVQDIIAAYELDPSRHRIPNKPVMGQLGGKPFQPNLVFVDGSQITLIQGDEHHYSMMVTISVYDSWKVNTKLLQSIKPGQVDSEKLAPAIWLLDGVKSQELKRYALTLELDPVNNGRVNGKIHLSIEGEPKDFIAGTFSTFWNRDITTPPSVEDQPYVSGMITHKIKPGDTLSVGYVNLSTPDSTEIFDSAIVTVNPGNLGSYRQHKNPPATATVRSNTTGDAHFYDFSKLTPGKYLIESHQLIGTTRSPSVWKVVEIKPDTQLNLPLTLEEPKTGEVEVSFAGGEGFSVYMLPLEIAGEGAQTNYNIQASTLLGTWALLKSGTAKVDKVPVGEYLAFQKQGDQLFTGKVKVEAGKLAKVTLEKKP